MSRFVHHLKPLFIFFAAGMFQPVLAPAQMTFPTPPETPQRLFYVQRDPNTNTIVYDANTISGGRAFDPKQPINIYWIRYASDGTAAPLSYIQRTLAYGVDIRPSSKPGEYEFNVVSYAKRKLRLIIDAQGRPRAILPINQKEAWLNRVYVKIEGKKVGIIPDVKYVELFGTDPHTGALVHEKFIP